MTSPRGRALLRQKLRSLAAYLDELESVIPATEEGYHAGSTVRRAVERLVQIVVECAADAGDLLLIQEGRTVGDTTREIFDALHANGVIPEDLRRRFTSSYSGLRNRIDHDYDELDHATSWRSAQQLVPDGRSLLAALTERVDGTASA